jgi:hypothetical protein
MSGVDGREPLALLRTGFRSNDWIAVLMKSYHTGETTQRILPLRAAIQPRFLAWLRAKNASRCEIYVGTNAVAPNQRSRTRDAIRTVRHVFLDADGDGQAVLDRLSRRGDLPQPSYVLRTSPDHVHVMWRVRGFAVDQVERLQKHLARELGGDTAATSASQMTRLPGFFNGKRERRFLVTMACGVTTSVFDPCHFPAVRPAKPRMPVIPAHLRQAADVIARARAYLDAIPPAIEGERGDAHTFRVCCRLVRGFALDDEQAMSVLSEWNVRCVPPWSEKDLAEKIRHARRYGREPVGGLLATELRRHT